MVRIKAGRPAVGLPLGKYLGQEAVEPGRAPVRVSTQQRQERRPINAQWGQYLGGVRLKPGAAAIQQSSLAWLLFGSARSSGKDAGWSMHSGGNTWDGYVSSRERLLLRTVASASVPTA